MRPLEGVPGGRNGGTLCFCHAWPSAAQKACSLGQKVKAGPAVAHSWRLPAALTRRGGVSLAGRSEPYTPMGYRHGA